jgi:hypothetical protein
LLINLLISLILISPANEFFSKTYLQGIVINNIITNKTFIKPRFSDLTEPRCKVTSSAKKIPKKSPMCLAIALSLGAASSPLLAADTIGATGAAGVDGSAGIVLNGGASQTINLGDRVIGGNGGPAGPYNTSGGYGIESLGDNNTIINAGSIIGGIGYSTDSTTTYSSAINAAGSLTVTNTNTGNITSLGNSYDGFPALLSYGNLIVNNSGSITSGGSSGIVSYGSTNTITNSGTITGRVSGISTIGGAGNTTILNEETGTITGTVSSGIYGYYGSIDVTNRGTINGGITYYSFGSHSGSLNSVYNMQGQAGSVSNPLVINYSLPHYYGIILGSNATTYGQITSLNTISWDAGSGKTDFSVNSGSVKSTIYSAVISGVSSSFLNPSTLTGSYGGYTWTLSETSSASGIWNLNFPGWTGTSGPSSTDTQSSMRYQASQLRSAFNTQSVAANFALNYDCNIFDAKGMCISAGGRYTTIDNPNINNSAAVVTLGYKVNPNIRIGAYLDQNIHISNPTGINISNNTPLMGLYAVWNKEQSGLGYQVRLANTYQDKDVTSTRTVFDTSEAGSGKSSLKSQSYLAELSYAFQYQDKTLVRPYAGLRYTHLKQKGYTEDTTDTVTDPLTLAALRDKSVTALLGVKINRHLTDKATLTAQLGLEQDVHHKVGNYSATNSDIGDLSSIAFNSNIKRTRPVASLGAFYDVSKTQRASATINYQQLPFQSTGSTTAYFNYMIGF